MPQLFSPKTTSAQLGIDESTLRAWAPLYAEFLSEYARRGRRQYTRRDLTILQAVRAMLDDRITHEQIPARLRAMDFGEDDLADTAPDTSASAQGDTAATTALVSLLGSQVITTQADQAQRLAAVEAQLADLRVTVARLEALVEALSRQQDSQADQVASIGSAAHRHSWIVPTRRG